MYAMSIVHQISDRCLTTARQIFRLTADHSKQFLRNILQKIL